MSTVRQPAGKYLAGSSAVAGKSEKKTQRRIDSFRFFITPPMTVKEETGDVLTETTEQTSTTRQQKETNIEPQLSRRSPTGLEERNCQPRIGRFWAWNFCTPTEVLLFSQETVWKVAASLQKLPGCMIR